MRIRNVSGEVYQSHECQPGERPVMFVIAPGEERDTEASKAEQMLRDFPDAFVRVEPESDDDEPEQPVSGGRSPEPNHRKPREPRFTR